MKLAVFDDHRVGVVEGDQIFDVTDAVSGAGPGWPPVYSADANTRDMIVNIPALIELISSVMTLNPGDVIASGTPKGVGPIVPGDEIRIGIESVGEMKIPVREAAVFSPRRF